MRAYDGRSSPSRIDDEPIKPLIYLWEKKLERPHSGRQIDATPARPFRIFQLSIIYMICRI
jgi:hypothetical protein